MVHRTNLGILGQIFMLEWLFLKEWKNGSMGVTYEGGDYKASSGASNSFLRVHWEPSNHGSSVQLSTSDRSELMTRG